MRVWLSCQVGGESGSADTARDPRGFAVKFYSEEGNWDLVGNNTPIFFIRDPILFPRRVLEPRMPVSSREYFVDELFISESYPPESQMAPEAVL